MKFSDISALILTFLNLIFFFKLTSSSACVHYFYVHYVSVFILTEVCYIACVSVMHKFFVVITTKLC